jgi:hypothetical protein
VTGLAEATVELHPSGAWRVVLPGGYVSFYDAESIEQTIVRHRSAANRAAALWALIQHRMRTEQASGSPGMLVGNGRGGAVLVPPMPPPDVIDGGSAVGDNQWLQSPADAERMADVAIAALGANGTPLGEPVADGDLALDVEASAVDTDYSLPHLREVLRGRDPAAGGWVTEPPVTVADGSTVLAESDAHELAGTPASDRLSAAPPLICQDCGHSWRLHGPDGCSREVAGLSERCGCTKPAPKATP